MSGREWFLRLGCLRGDSFPLAIRGVAVFVVFLVVVMTGGSVMAFEISSDAFASGHMIPSDYTCTGRDVSCPLSWSQPPQATASFVLICDDPDAPGGMWVHWVIYNIPAKETRLPEGVAPDPLLADGSRQGVNDFGKTGYGGPCPPPGQAHRYYFKLYALDTMLDLRAPVKKKDVERAMQGHVLGQATLMGQFRR